MRRALRHHFRDVVGDDLERNVAVGNRGDQLPGVSRVVANAGLLQQRGIGCETGDPGLLGHIHDLRLVGAVGEQLDLQICQCGGGHGASSLIEDRSSDPTHGKGRGPLQAARRRFSGPRSPPA